MSSWLTPTTWKSRKSHAKVTQRLCPDLLDGPAEFCSRRMLSALRRQLASALERRQKHGEIMVFAGVFEVVFENRGKQGRGSVGFQTSARQTSAEPYLLQKFLKGPPAAPLINEPPQKAAYGTPAGRAHCAPQNLPNRWGQSVPAELISGIGF